jgi:hypothetical protein
MELFMKDEMERAGGKRGGVLIVLQAGAAKQRK